MAAAQLAIAKASLLASFLKADADAGLASCSRDEIEQFHGLLNAAVAKCSPTNVQKCKQWILQHLVESPARAVAFGKYLVALASSFPGGAQKAPGPSSKRRRLHVLYVLNDVLFHVKFRTRSPNGFFDKIAPHLPALFKSAASFTNAPKHTKKLHDLLQLWDKNSYFSTSVLESLRAAVEEGPKSEGSEANGGDVSNKAQASSTAREAPFILPSMHGDPSTPWYDLPAANWLPVIEPNSTRPMNPNMIKPLQLAGGPADKNLVDAVKKLLGDVDKIYAKDAHMDGDSAFDVSQMGEFIERDELGDIVGGETYYGWSRNFCDKMRARRHKGDGMDIDDDEQRGRRGSSRSSSRSRSPSRRRSSRRDPSHPATKRRRLSHSRGRSWSRSSASRSRSRGGRGSRSPRRQRSYSRSTSRSRSSRRGQNGRGRPRSRLRDSYSPQPVLSGAQNSHGAGYGPPKGFVPPNPQPYHQQQAPPLPVPPPPPPPSGPYAHPNFPAGGPPPPPQPSRFNSWNAAAPPPPPPPPHYQGQWPPPPPPPPMAGSHGPQQQQQQPPQGWFPPVPGPFPPGQWGGGWAAPPPPPPPYPPQGGHPEQHQQPGGFQYGRGGSGGGGGSYRGRGGGGYGRGRGW
ncbi:hypothetical protein KVR01_011172 [Diaporthe batatas]|uniref:uncharacterized protein n=1 Tax=Diaporthe batatas TaxID=748121 RepID=UPI001D03ECE0|nr:uncharacterized protein KVR01_011172 [Diaporthe batatas]KAG8158729.1 hypothetical protein KVR01_011172 [Diaporthe batatas]